MLCVLDARLVEITEIFANPPQPETPAPEEQPEPPADEAAPTPEVAVGGLPPSVAPSGSFHFMQEDELEASPELGQSAAEQQEWVQVSESETAPEIEVSETTVELHADGHTLVQETVTVTTTSEVSPVFAESQVTLKECCGRSQVTVL